MMVFVMSTYRGAEYLRRWSVRVGQIRNILVTQDESSMEHVRTYVRFRSRASLGIMGDGAPSLSQWVGLDR